MIQDLSSSSVLALVDDFLSWVFKVQVDKANKWLSDIMKTNYYLPNKSAQCPIGFIYKGAKYSYPGDPPSIRLERLDSSLDTVMDSLISFTSSYEVEKEKVKFLIAAACSTCDTCYQLPSLLPEVCNGFFRPYLSLDTGIVPDYVKPLDQTVILAFQEKHKTNLDTLYARVTKNLLGVM